MFCNVQRHVCRFRENQRAGEGFVRKAVKDIYKEMIVILLGPAKERGKGDRGGLPVFCNVPAGRCHLPRCHLGGSMVWGKEDPEWRHWQLCLGNAGRQDATSPSLTLLACPWALARKLGTTQWPRCLLRCTAGCSFPPFLGTCQGLFAGLFSLIHFNQKINQETPVQ